MVVKRGEPTGNLSALGAPDNPSKTQLWYTESMDDTLPDSHYQPTVAQVETPALGFRQYTVPWEFERNENIDNLLGVIRQMEDHALALRLQQWAWFQLEEAKTIPGVSRVRFSVDMEKEDRVLVGTLFLKQHPGLAFELLPGKSLSARNRQQGTPVDPKVIGAIGEWLENVDRYYPNTFEAAVVVNQVFEDPQGVSLKNIEKTVMALLPKTIQAEVRQVQLEEKLQAAPSATSRMRL